MVKPEMQSISTPSIACLSESAPILLGSPASFRVDWGAAQTAADEETW